MVKTDSLNAGPTPLPLFMHAMPNLDAVFVFAKALGLHDDAVFLTVFIVLSYRRLVDQDLHITLGSTMVTILIAAASAQLAALLLKSTFGPPMDPVPDGAPLGFDDAAQLLHSATERFFGV